MKTSLPHGNICHNLLHSSQFSSNSASSTPSKPPILAELIPQISVLFFWCFRLFLGMYTHWSSFHNEGMNPLRLCVLVKAILIHPVVLLGHHLHRIQWEWCPLELFKREMALEWRVQVGRISYRKHLSFILSWHFKVVLPRASYLISLSPSLVTCEIGIISTSHSCGVD